MMDLSVHSDEDLFLLTKQGDNHAFAQIYTKHWQIMYNTARNILRDEDAVHDILQNIFVSLWQRRNDLEITSLKSYLQQATRFAVFKAIRQTQHDKELYKRISAITVEIITEEPLLIKEQSQLLKRLVDKLPEDCRESFRLSREEGLTYKQIAALLGISEKTVEKRISKSLKLLRHGLSFGICISLLNGIN
ncbi:RNA polymerase sigma factor [Pedobacter mucosus]|uniref:RNA polymerase sigma factor n=1 Tax=Pedobacter mucosus TaxID=2895286 RepID=UPI001EE42E40|nr:sigma-70 family RNA polymerase sigma factor [Pedobacter mucosus]UKT64975.1 sigma-70 family RNA polymerase sigma factor [Pedobacter mucosus]